MKRNIYKLLLSAKQGLFAIGLVVSGATYSQITYTLNYTGSVQTQTLPAGLWQIECWGADGGDVTAGPGGGGTGGYSKGEYLIGTSGTILNVFIGGKGGSASGTGSPAGSGGWNGGGGGGYCGRSGGGGGGATDVRIGGTAASDRVIVAGGGGGAAYYSQMAIGGNGGSQMGQDGDYMTSGNVLTVGGGGAGANGPTPGVAGAGYPLTGGSATGGGGGGHSPTGFGQPGIGGGAGGSGGTSAGGATGGSGGGGGGYAGGAGGTQTSNAAVGGGGGSGYVGGVTNGVTTMSGQTSFVPNPVVTGNGLVVITELCNISVAAAKNPICIGESVVLTTDALAPISWSSGGTTSSVVVSPTTTTSYSVTGTGTNVCVTTVVIKVDVVDLPVITPTVNPILLCVGESATLTSSGALTYTWSNNTNGTMTSVSPSVNTTYSVSATSIYGCINNDVITVNVNTNSITVPAATTICQNTMLNIVASGAVTYTWNTGWPFGAIPVTPSVSTVYSVIGVDVNNCVLTNSVSVNVNPAPNVFASSDKDVICKGESVTLSGTGASSYAWSNPVGGTGNGASLTLNLNIDIPYTFSVTGTDANGCTATATVLVMVEKCSGINEASGKNLSFNLYPNPTSGIFTIKSEKINSGMIEIVDLSGKVVFTETIKGNRTDVNMSAFGAGVYFVKVKNETSSEVIKLIKN